MSEAGQPVRGIAGVLLAAGRGRRLGGSKQLLPWPPGAQDVRPLVAASFDAIEPACDRMLVVVGHHAAAVAGSLGSRVFETVLADPDAPMYESLRVGLEAAQRQGLDVLMQPGDHPDLRSGTLEVLLEARRAAPEKVINVQFDGHGGHPVLLPLEVVNDLILWSGDGGLRRWLDDNQQCVTCVQVDDPGVIRDVDTIADYRR